MKHHLFLLLGSLALLCTGTILSAQGLLGTDYYSAGGSFTHNNTPVANVDIWSAELEANYNLYSEQDLGIDWGVQGTVGTDDKKGYTWQNQIVAFNATPYYSLTPELKAFGTVALGYSHQREAVSGLVSHSKNDLQWGMAAGLEYVLDQLSFAGSAGYFRATNGAHSGVWAFGAEANYWLDSNWAVSAGYTYLDYKHGHGNQVAAKVRVRF